MREGRGRLVRDDESDVRQRRKAPGGVEVNTPGAAPRPDRGRGAGASRDRVSTPRGLLSAALLASGVLVVVLATTAWAVRVLFSDSVATLQQIGWIPVPLVLTAMLLGLGMVAGGGAIAFRVWAKRLVVGGAALLLVVAVEHLSTRWGWVGGCSDPIRIVHWNAASPKPEAAAVQQVELARREWDILVVSNDATLFGRWFAHRWEDGPGGEAWTVRRAGPFALVTSLPVLESRLAIASRDIWLGVFRVELPIAGGREVVIHALDLPSDPTLPRAALLADLRRRLDDLQLPEPDLVLGDLNLDAGSAALAAAYPDLLSAFEQAGDGYAASYPRNLPLWQTDQTMVAADLPICRYRFIDLGFGTHRAQELSLERSGDARR